MHALGAYSWVVRKWNSVFLFKYTLLYISVCYKELEHEGLVVLVIISEVCSSASTSNLGW